MTNTNENADTGIDTITLAADLVCAYVSNNHVQPGELGKLISDVHATLSSLGGAPVAAPAPAAKATPAEIRRSITPDHLVSFEDGRNYKTLRRHLTTHGLTPQDYRAKWGLPSDYPMVSTSYSERRSALARSIGLGRPAGKAEEAASQPAAEAAPEPVVVEATEAKGRRGGRRKAA